MALIRDGGLTTRSVRCHECEVFSGSEFKEFRRALISIVTIDESIEDGCSNGQAKSSAYAKHRGSSSCVIHMATISSENGRKIKFC